MRPKKLMICFAPCSLILLSFFSQAPAQTPTAKLTPGSSAPELGLTKVLQAPEGAQSDLASLKGKVVVLEFWATWCAPCIAQQPHLNEMIDKFDHKPVVFISITDEDESKVSSFLKRRQLKGWIGLDTSRSAQNAYEAFAIPKTIIIDQQGRIASVMQPRSLSEVLLDQVIEGTYVSGSKQPQIVGMNNKDRQTDKIADSKVSVWLPQYQITDQLSIKIKPAESSESKMMVGNDRFIAQNLDLKSILASLLEVTATRIYLPPVFEDKRYDIQVMLRGDKSGSYKSLAVQAIETALAIAVKHETREVDSYTLTAPGRLTGSLQPSTAKNWHASSDKGALAASGADISFLHDGIEAALGVPVVDETGLQGKFDWDLLFDAKVPTSLIDAAWKDLGLKLTSARRPLAVIVVEAK